MAGHSHASNVAHKKAIVDKKRAKIFTKVGKAVMQASREGGKDPDANPKLRLAIEKAKAANMPKDRIEKAILKGAGELSGDNLDEKTYEGYGPGGVAIIVDCLTDNTNRTTGEVRHIFSKRGGNMGDSGCVSWGFKSKGLLAVKAEGLDEDEVMMHAIDAGAEDVNLVEGVFEILTPPELLAKTSQALQEVNIVSDVCEITKIADNEMELELEEAKRVLGLIDLLEDNDDVQNVYSNLVMTEELLAQ